MPIGQISFMRMDGPVENPYGASEAGSKYQGQAEPTASRYYLNFEQASENGAARQAKRALSSAGPRRLPLPSAAMPNIGPLEIAIVLVIVLIIFGPKRLPELGQSMGRGIREFRGSITGDKDKDDVDEKQAAARGERTEAAEPEGAENAEPVEGEVVTENKS